LITTEQIRAARALLRITVAELSVASGVGVATIKRLEAGRGVPSVHTRTLDQIFKALSSSGVEFIGTPEDKPGVRLVKPTVK
jgi:transcriptional regulator with XRE-family HTH domain